jgi:hypothetical protein
VNGAREELRRTVEKKVQRKRVLKNHRALVSEMKMGKEVDGETGR